MSTSSQANDKYRVSFASAFPTADIFAWVWSIGLLFSRLVLSLSVLPLGLSFRSTAWSMRVFRRNGYSSVPQLVEPRNTTVDLYAAVVATSSNCAVQRPRSSRLSRNATFTLRRIHLLTLQQRYNHKQQSPSLHPLLLNISNPTSGLDIFKNKNKNLNGKQK